MYILKKIVNNNLGVFSKLCQLNKKITFNAGFSILKVKKLFWKC
jgi:hypothetical protein